MTQQRRRVLIINAADRSDLLRAARLVEQYQTDGKLAGRSGRYHLTLYATRDDPPTDPVCVWHSATQITVHFGDRGG